MKILGCAIALMAIAIANPALAQVRVQTTLPPPPPEKPGYQAPEIDPLFQRLNALQAQLDALRESAGRQLVVLHFNDGQGEGWYEGNPGAYAIRSANLCKQALGDRYGRTVWYLTDSGSQGIYFSQLICETKP